MIGTRDSDCNAGGKEKRRVTDCKRNECLGETAELMRPTHQQKRKSEKETKKRKKRDSERKTEKL